MCVENGTIWVLFGHQVNKMNEKLSFKMGVKFAAPLHTGLNVLNTFYEISGVDKPN